jgi:hypothetical protein
MRIPKAGDAVVEVMSKALIALPDLERMVETGRMPDDMTWVRELAGAARRLLSEMDGAKSAI